MAGEKELTGECGSCGYEGAHTQITMTDSENTKGVGQEPWELCDICYCTLAGNSARYPSQYEEARREMYMMVAYVGNMIMARLDKLEKK